jgi:signal transduction histidine kinase
MGEQEIRSRLAGIRLAVGHAAQTLSAERHLSGELRDYIQKLDRQSDRIADILALRDLARIARLVDDMELLGARARRVCGSGLPLSGQMKSAVNRMHDELIELKQRIDARRGADAGQHLV